MEYKPIYLVMVTASANNNKYYRMIPQSECFKVEFGRVGNSGFQTATYPISKWDKKYNEKIKKGYQDRTNLVADLIEEEKVTKKRYTDIPNKDIAEIVDRLQAMANKAISDNYTISSNKVTQAMVDEAQTLLANLVLINDLETFNEQLLELFTVIPRKMGNVKNYLANTLDDFGEIIKAEQDLLDVMRGQVVQHTITEDKQEPDEAAQVNILEALGLRFSEVDDGDVIKIKGALGSCANQYQNAWRVENIDTQKRFSDYITIEGNIDTKLLWHGSRNENWWSIINSGLILKPTNAVITGKMFGYGTYFATKARKSIGYTSLSGSYWARGSAHTAFMGLYEVAYGNPYDVYSFDSKYYNFDYNKLQQNAPGTHCLHAHEGNMLRNDEIIVYKEEQTTIKYLVEITN